MTYGNFDFRFAFYVSELSIEEAFNLITYSIGRQLSSNATMRHLSHGGNLEKVCIVVQDDKFITSQKEIEVKASTIVELFYTRSIELNQLIQDNELVQIYL